MTIDCCLATYGSLAPGQPNHHQLASLRGTWMSGTVTGRLVASGWGAAMGYPALVPDPQGDCIPVQLFTSPDLPDHWARLDGFEGSEYRRVPVAVQTADAVITAWIYVSAG